MPLPSSGAVFSSPAVALVYFACGKQPLAPREWKKHSCDWWNLSAPVLTPGSVLFVPLTHWSKMQEQVCNWYWISSAISLCVISYCFPTFCLLVRSCLIALPAHARQLFLLRQNVAAPVSCASQSLLFLRPSIRLTVIVLSHRRALWYGSPHRETAVPWVFLESAFLAIFLELYF